MEGSFKISFKDDDSFIIYYIIDDIYETEDEYKELFKYIDSELIKRFKYYLHGFYDVTIYYYSGIYVLDFDYIDDYGRKDFNVTILLNSEMLLEDIENTFYEEKIYYQEKYYIDIKKVRNDIRLFEYGNIIYGKKVEEILNNGKFINMKICY